MSACIHRECVLCCGVAQQYSMYLPYCFVVSGCADVVEDDGRAHGEKGGDMCRFLIVHKDYKEGRGIGGPDGLFFWVACTWSASQFECLRGLCICVC